MRKTMNIDERKLKKARKILRARNDTQTVDEALSLVIANREIEEALRVFRGSIPDLEVR